MRFWIRIILNLYNEYVKPSELKSFLHGDAYDTNILQDGIIIDTERVCIGHPMFDITYFIHNPKYDGFDREECISGKKYKNY